MVANLLYSVVLISLVIPEVLNSGPSSIPRVERLPALAKWPESMTPKCPSIFNSSNWPQAVFLISVLPFIVPPSLPLLSLSFSSLYNLISFLIVVLFLTIAVFLAVALLLFWFSSSFSMSFLAFISFALICCICFLLLPFISSMPGQDSIDEPRLGHHRQLKDTPRFLRDQRGIGESDGGMRGWI
ncbi:hypothetical protein VTK56DRAFT_2963 [Thermocarpiscus australiensis]